MKAGVDYVGVCTSFYCHDDEGNFVFAKRSKNCRDEHGRWDPGSGALDHGLTFRENVLKEVKEEYGCDGEIEAWLPPITILREHGDQKTHWVAIGAFVKIKSEEVKNMEPHKFDEMALFKFDDLPNPLHSGFEYHYAQQKDIFHQYINRFTNFKI